MGFVYHLEIIRYMTCSAKSVRVPGCLLRDERDSVRDLSSASPGDDSETVVMKRGICTEPVVYVSSMHRPKAYLCKGES